MRNIIIKNKLKRKKKDLGAFFTPSQLASTLTEFSINYYLVKRLNSIFCKSYATIDEIFRTADFSINTKLIELIRNIKILDGAAGEGEFLIASVKYLNIIQDKIYKKMDLNPSIKENLWLTNIYGMEINQSTINKCYKNILNSISIKKRSKVELKLQKNVINGNFLDSDLSNWKNLTKKGFDIVLGNPPWGAKLTKEEKDRYHKQLMLTSPKRNLNTFELFVYQSSKFLIPEIGILAFLLPKNVVRSNHYTHLRGFIVNNFLIFEINFHGLFRDVTQEFISLIAQYTKNIPSNHTVIVDKTKKIPQSFYQTNVDFIFNKEYNAETIKLVQYMQVGTLPLNEFVTIRRGEELSKKGGIMFCPDCDEWVPLSSRKQEIKCPRCQNVLKTQNLEIKFLIQKDQNDIYSQPILTGDDFDSFSINSSHFIDPLIEYISKKKPNIYRSPKIVVQKIKRHPCAAFDSKNHWTTQNVYNLTLNSKYSNKVDLLHFILAVLNSSLIRTYYEVQFNLGSNYTNAISIKNLKRLPIKEPNFSSPLFQRIVDLSKTIQSEKKGNKKDLQLKKLNELIDQYFTS